jgi:hypothetical protein
LSRKAKTYITAVQVTGISLLAYELAGFHTDNLTRFLVFLGMTVASCGLKVRLPGVQATFSVHFLFTLAAITQLTLPEVLAASVSGALVQTYWRPKTRVTWIHATFNAANGTFSYSAAYAIYHWTLLNNADIGLLGRLATASIAMFLANTVGVAIVLALTENKSWWTVWTGSYLWCIPYHLLGAVLVAAISYVSRWFGWFAALGTLPVMLWMYRLYRVYWGRLEAEKHHAEEMAAVHLRTIEALAMAINAKDRTTHDHLRRVQVYAIETAKELNLSPEEIQALRAASVLHDIGKLAVPEHIISKPGRLTPEEFEKMKFIRW